MEGRILFTVCFLVLSYISLAQCRLHKPLSDRLKYKESKRRLISGPIFLLDKRTILITQFSYENLDYKDLIKKHNKWFKCVVTGEETLVDLEFDDGQIAQIQGDYLGKNIYLKVPSTVESDITAFSAIVIVNQKNEMKTSVAIHPEDVFDLPEHLGDQQYQNGSFIFRYPKCCPLDTYAEEGNSTQYDCINARGQTMPAHFPVHEVRKSKYYSDGMTHIIYEPFVSNWDTCDKVAFSSADNLSLLSNMEFLVHNVADRSKVACIDYIKEDDKLEEVVFVCVEDLGYNHSTSVFYQSQSVLLGLVILLAAIKL